MSNLLQYTLSLQDRMSASLKAIGINSDTALQKFSKLEKQAQEVRKTFNNMGTSIGALRQKLDLLKAEREWIPTSNIKAIKEYNAEIDKLERKISKLDGTARRSNGRWSNLRNFAGGALLASGISLGVSGMISGAGNLLTSGMEAGKNRMSFEVLSGKEAGGKLFADLTKFAQDSIFGTEVYDNAKVLRAFGVETEKVMPALKMLGDISMGDKNRLQSLNLAYAQIMSTGRLMGQDLLQLVNAGFNPLKIISEKTGYGLTELREKMEDGQISSRMIEEAFKAATSAGGTFYKMTDKIAETPFGKWEAFKGQLQGVAMQIGLALMPAFSKVLTILGNMANKLPDVINSITPLFDVLSSFPFDKLIGDIMGLVGPLLTYLIPVFQNVIYWVGQIWDSLSPIFIALQPIIGMVAASVSDLTAQLMPLVARIVKLLVPILTVLIQLLTGPLKWALQLIGWLFEKLMWLVNKILWPFEKLGNAFDWLSKKINGLFGSDTLDGVSVGAQSTGFAAGEGLASGFLKAYDPDKINSALGGGINDPSLIDMYSTAGENHANAYTSAFSAKWMVGLGKPWSFIDSFPGAIKGPSIPGASDFDFKGAFLSGKDGKNKGGRSASNNAVATGGQKSTTIHINIGKQIETLTVMASNIKEGAERIREIVLDEMTRAIAMSQSIAD